MTTIAENIASIRKRIADACGRAGRDASEVRLIAVTKNRDVEEIRKALEAGVNDLGENRVQEAREKVGQLPDSVEWHLIGHLQTNKAKYAARMFRTIHSLDSERLAEALEKEAAKREVELRVLLQLNVAGEESKFGLSPDFAGSLLRVLKDMPHLRAVGLMTIAPFVEDPETVRRYFKELRERRDALRQDFPELCELSIGMTQDYEVAVEEGATMVRIGTAIFGPRD